MKHSAQLILLVTVSAYLTGCAAMIAPSAAQLAVADYGTYPTNYEDIVKTYLHNTLLDPNSVQDLNVDTPTQYYIQEPPIMGGHTLYGYMVSYSLNAKNSFGGYVGVQKHFILIRDGQIIKAWEPGQL
jgi:hypothetical protein